MRTISIVLETTWNVDVVSTSGSWGKLTVFRKISWVFFKIANDTFILFLLKNGFCFKFCFNTASTSKLLFLNNINCYRDSTFLNDFRSF